MAGIAEGPVSAPALSDARIIIDAFPPADFEFVRLAHADDPSHRPFFRAVSSTTAKKFVLRFLPSSPRSTQLLDEVVGLHGAVAAGVLAVAQHVQDVNARVAGSFEQRSELTGTGISVEEANATPVQEGVLAAPSSPQEGGAIVTTHSSTHQSTTNNITNYNNGGGGDSFSADQMVELGNRIAPTNPFAAEILKIVQTKRKYVELREDDERRYAALRAQDDRAHQQRLRDIESRRMNNKSEHEAKMATMERVVYTAEAASASKALDRDASKMLLGRLLAVDGGGGVVEGDAAAPSALSTALSTGARRTAHTHYVALYPDALPLDTGACNTLRANVHAAFRRTFSKQILTFVDNDKVTEGRSQVCRYSLDQLHAMRVVFEAFRAERGA